MSRRRGTFSLLFATALLAIGTAGCSPGAAAKPDLPASVSPGWKLTKLETSQPPARLPQSGTPPACWLANYAGESTANVWVCAYPASTGAFDAAQRMPSTATEVKFQKGSYLVVVQWTTASRADITALVGAIQRSLPVG